MSKCLNLPSCLRACPPAAVQRLEREFTEFPLLPSDALRDEAEAVMAKAETLSGAGFRSSMPECNCPPSYIYV